MFMKLPVRLDFTLDHDLALSGWMAGLIGTKTDYPVGTCSIRVFDREFPFMSTTRHGALELYLLFPFLRCCGNNIVALRMASIWWGIIIIILTYSLVSKFFNNKIGILSAALLVINSNFINFLRWGNVFGFTMPIFSLVCLGLFWKWYKTKKSLFFYLAMFALGLGVNAKGWFVWFVIALFISYVIHCRYYRIKIKTILIGFLFMVLSLLPIICCNFKHNGQLANFILCNWHITDYGIDNFQFIRNLLIRMGHFELLMNQDMYTGGYFYLFRNYPLIFFIFTIASLFYFHLYSKKMIFSNRRCVLILSVTLLTFILSTFTFTTFYPGHLYILFPYPQIIMAVVIYTIFRFLKPRLLKILFFLFVIMLIVAEVGKCLESYRIYKNRMEINQGSSIYDLAAWISDREQDKTIIWCDYIWPTYLFFLDKNIHPSQVRTFYIDKKNNINQFSNIVSEMVNPESIFVFVNLEDSLEYKIFLGLAQDLDKQVVEEKRFINRDGETRFMVCSLRDRYQNHLK
jgi:hypothetical protein